MGTPSAEMVRQRAAELAAIDGRDTPSEQDWKRAFMELHGGHHEPGGHEEETEMLGAVMETDTVAPTLGRHLHEMDIEGSESLGEELISEGLEEASHDRMIESRKEEKRESKR
ncbi:MAG: hypothetical protein PHQ12_02815 [Chthoniobacteraceae bacterium]|nr:hypothetical protein [Chthoniobacteraceae bacterium]